LLYYKNFQIGSDLYVFELYLNFLIKIKSTYFLTPTDLTQNEICAYDDMVEKILPRSFPSSLSPLYNHFYLVNLIEPNVAVITGLLDDLKIYLLDLLYHFGFIDDFYFSNETDLIIKIKLIYSSFFDRAPCTPFFFFAIKKFFYD